LFSQTHGNIVFQYRRIASDNVATPVWRSVWRLDQLRERIHCQHYSLQTEKRHALIGLGFSSVGTPATAACATAKDVEKPEFEASLTMPTYGQGCCGVWVERTDTWRDRLLQALNSPAPILVETEVA
jgi:hypothetical protein